MILVWLSFLYPIPNYNFNRSTRRDLMERYAETTKQTYEGWDEFYSKPVDEKLEFYKQKGRVFDVIFAQQFDRQFLDDLCDLADKIRLLAKTKAGAQKLSSFCRTSGPCSTSSSPPPGPSCRSERLLPPGPERLREPRYEHQLRGERRVPEDTIRTFASYLDLIISRHPEAGFAEKTSWVLNQTERPVPVLNGGSGPDQHPTQALLDIYTLQREFQAIGGIDGKKIAMVGDLKRGRTVRSLSYLMKNYKNVTLYFVAPEVFRMQDDIKAFLNKHAIPFHETDDFESVMPKVDAIYMTRIQNEYASDPKSETETFPNFHFREGTPHQDPRPLRPHAPPAPALRDRGVRGQGPARGLLAPGAQWHVDPRRADRLRFPRRAGDSDRVCLTPGGLWGLNFAKSREDFKPPPFLCDNGAPNQVRCKIGSSPVSDALEDSNGHRRKKHP